MHQSGSVSLCRSAISVLVATALYSPIALASTVEYGETVDGVVLEKDIQLVYGTANNTKINPGGEQHIKEFGVSNNTEINGGYQYIEMNGAAEYSVLNWICPYISRHLLSLNPLQARCRRYSRGER